MSGSGLKLEFRGFDKLGRQPGKYFEVGRQAAGNILCSLNEPTISTVYPF